MQLGLYWFLQLREIEERNTSESKGETFDDIIKRLVILHYQKGTTSTANLTHA
jgi:hypothetical protein